MCKIIFMAIHEIFASRKADIDSANGSLDLSMYKHCWPLNPISARVQLHPGENFRPSRARVLIELFE